MCGFAGIFSFKDELLERKSSWISVIRRMGKRLTHSCEVYENSYISENLAVSYLTFGSHPCSVTVACEEQYFAAVSGEAINAAVLRSELQRISSADKTPAELVVQLYQRFGDTFTAFLEGTFSGFVVDLKRKAILLFRDAVGKKSLYYTVIDDFLIFASEIKGILEYPGVNPMLSKETLFGYMSDGDISLPDETFFEGIHRLVSGHYAVYGTNGVSDHILSLGPVLHAERNIKSSHFKSQSNVNIIASKIKEKQICGLLLEAAIKRDRPSLSAQEDILLLSLCKRANPCSLFIDALSTDSEEIMKDLYEAVPESYQLPRFGKLLKEKLQAYIRDKSQPIHLLMSEDEIKEYLSDAEQNEKRLFFFLQLCLWMNHYKVRIPD